MYQILPVRRYLIPTPSTKGEGGIEPTSPMISKKVDSTNFNFGKPLELSIRCRKPVELMSKLCQVSMATDLHEGVFSKILLKND